MARPIKRGLDYFPLDIDFFNDIKIRKLIKYQGGKAVAVYTHLLCNIYRNGYYLVWDDELPFIISEVTGYDEAYIQEAIKCCMNIGLFSKKLFDEEGIITSKGIQSRYEMVCKNGNKKAVVSEFNLVPSEETPISSEETPVKSEFSTQRKVNKRKVKGITPIPPKGDDVYSFNDFWDDYDKKRGDKQKLVKMWNKLSDNEKMLIREYIPKYKEAEPEKQYRKDPQTFLNNKSWNDELIEKKHAGSKENKRNNSDADRLEWLAREAEEAFSS